MDTLDRDNLNSPFQNVFHILPKGHDKAVRKAFYNIAAILFVLFSSATAVAIYYILQPFLRPLLWAVLCGTFLYPFKYKVTTGARQWLRGLQVSRTPLILGFIFLPVVILYNFIDYLGRICWNNVKIITFCCFSVPAIGMFLTIWPVQEIVDLTTNVLIYSEKILSFFSSSWIWSLVIGYLLIVAFCYNDRTKIFLTLGSFFLWIAVCFHLTNVLNGHFVLGMCIVTSLLAAIGLVNNLFAIRDKPNLDPKKHDDAVDAGTITNRSQASHPSNDVTSRDVHNRNISGLGGVDGSNNDSVKSTVIKNVDCVDNNSMGAGNKAFDAAAIDPAKTHMFLSLADYEVASKKSFSDYCLLVLLWCTILVQLWIYKILFIIVPFLVLCFIVKALDNYLEIWSFLRSWLTSNAVLLKRDLTNNSRFSVVVPRPVRYVFKLVLDGDSKIIRILDTSIDKICSAFIVVLLVLGVGLVAVLITLEVHKESMHLVQISGNVFNRSEHPELTRWLPDDEVLQYALDSAVKNAYVYGREWIIRQLNGFLHGDDVDKEHIEKQLLKLWDTLYNSWINKNKLLQMYEHQLSLGDFSIINASFPFTYLRMKKMNLNLIDIARENVDLFVSVLKSIWSVLVTNVALSMKILTSMVSVIFGGGTAIFNTLLSMVIFLTTLFYLLSSSHCQYKPVEMIFSLSPSYVNNFMFAKAFQDAINSVFLVSCKMAAFYGLYTWLTHSLLGIQIVFIPSILAAVFAAVPFLGTYVACLPAVVELWLVNGQPIQALVLFAAHYLPTLFIDTAFYSEIKGGHPYLTGLAILGGIYWMGLEGAIVGPVLLCCFVVAVHIYQAMLQPGSDDRF